uniref:Uncharacterized protein n=1 Tax=Strigamia maritima TaxID=126957 RepID=T1JMI7_STRMM
MFKVNRKYYNLLISVEGRIIPVPKLLEQEQSTQLCALIQLPLFTFKNGEHYKVITLINIQHIQLNVCSPFGKNVLDCSVSEFTRNSTFDGTLKTTRCSAFSLSTSVKLLMDVESCSNHSLEAEPVAVQFVNVVESREDLVPRVTLRSCLPNTKKVCLKRREYKKRVVQNGDDDETRLGMPQIVPPSHEVTIKRTFTFSLKTIYLRRSGRTLDIYKYLIKCCIMHSMNK